MKRIICHTRGGTRGNPGPAGVGVVARAETGGLLFEGSQFIGNATTIYAEYAAVVLVLSELKQRLGKETKKCMVEIRMDSEMAQKQLAGLYQIKDPSLVPQFIEIHNLRVSSFPNIKFTHVRREENSEADRLANEAMERQA